METMPTIDRQTGAKYKILGWPFSFLSYSKHHNAQRQNISKLSTWRVIWEVRITSSKSRFKQQTVFVNEYLKKIIKKKK